MLLTLKYNLFLKPSSLQFSDTSRHPTSVPREPDYSKYSIGVRGFLVGLAQTVWGSGRWSISVRFWVKVSSSLFYDLFYDFITDHFILWLCGFS